MSNELQGKTVAFIVHNSGVEQPELTRPWEAVEQAGGTAVLIAPEKGPVQAFTDDVEKADTFEATEALSAVAPDDYDALVIPGGTTNADQLRAEDDAVDFVKAFVDAGKPVAAICHAPWMLVEAGVLPGKTLTSFHTLQTDVRNAGAAEWVDREVMVCPANDWTLVTSRDPDDLDAFCAALVEQFAA